ncbi:hypothetical protein GNI_003520 [Gregarina niphandrodes]|uniref:WD domain, G-beta repeat protein n=1 Tax=Gregarina niphandrodes TaxID=110365 RepID=A0A023BDJ0_GRENI|nr:hypothetical protein GNI_003520 [Gregarina niphandrodes]EZG89012.1 hypothetical protein GNI_003520 [Gregarina niphandrodes]|eukprot:XP_011128519.1 hypothetical protein GNI_003520 [Gregarina niphandrodes]
MIRVPGECALYLQNVTQACAEYKPYIQCRARSGVEAMHIIEQRSVEFAEDYVTQSLVFADGSLLFFVDFETKTERQFAGFKTSLSALSPRDDGKLVAVGCIDGLLGILRVEDIREPIRWWKRHTGKIVACEFLGVRTHVVSVCSQRRLCVWDLAKDQDPVAVVHELATAEPISVAAHSTEPYTFFVGFSDGCIRKYMYHPPQNTHDDEWGTVKLLQSCTVIPGDRASRSGQAMDTTQATSPGITRLVHRLVPEPGPETTSISDAVAPSGSGVLFASQDNAVNILLDDLSPSTAAAVEAAVDEVMAAPDQDEGPVVARHVIHLQRITDLKVVDSTDGLRAVTSSADGTVKVTRLGRMGWELLQRVDARQVLLACVGDAESKFLGSSAVDGDVRVDQVRVRPRYRPGRARGVQWRCRCGKKSDPSEECDDCRTHQLRVSDGHPWVSAKAEKFMRTHQYTSALCYACEAVPDMAENGDLHSLAYKNKRRKENVRILEALIEAGNLHRAATGLTNQQFIQAVIGLLDNLEGDLFWCQDVLFIVLFQLIQHNQPWIRDTQDEQVVEVLSRASELLDRHLKCMEKATALSAITKKFFV